MATFMNNEGEYGKYIIQDLQAPQTGTPEFQEMYKKFSNRILWIDNNVCPGSMQMNTAWYYAVPEKDPVFEEHSHESEHHILTKSSLIFCPADMPHMRISIKRVDKPIFHFSVMRGGTYNGGAYK